MAISSSFFCATSVSAGEAKAFSRMVRSGRMCNVAAKPAENGRNMAAAFAKTGTVRIELKPPPTGPRKLPLGVALTGYQIRLKLEDDC